MFPSKLKSVGLSPPRPEAGSTPKAAIFDGRRQVRIQALLTACCGAAWLLAGEGVGAAAALLGGLAALAGTVVFLGVLRWRESPAPTPGQALRALVLAEAAKWSVSLVGLAALLAGWSGLAVAQASPGAVVTGFCVAWVAPLLALVKRS
jgi:F0F1-type ATP synthase assembly protein I